MLSGVDWGPDSGDKGGSELRKRLTAMRSVGRLSPRRPSRLRTEKRVVPGRGLDHAERTVAAIEKRRLETDTDPLGGGVGSKPAYRRAAVCT